MTPEQPNALRLADALDRKQIPAKIDQHDAAAELRRQHAVNAELVEAAEAICEHYAPLDSLVSVKPFYGAQDDVILQHWKNLRKAKAKAKAKATVAVDHPQALSVAELNESLLSLSEQRWILQSPAAIAQLMTFIDIDHSHGVSVLGAEECQPWPPKRYTELKDMGRKIITEDPECFDESILREFGFPLKPATGTPS